MKRGVKRGNSTLDPLSDVTSQSVNKRIKQKTKNPPHQSTKKSGDDSFVSVSVDSNENTQQNIAYYKNIVDKLENQVRVLTADIRGQQKQITELVSQLSFVTSWLENSVTPEQCSAAFKDFAAAVKRPAAVDRSAQESAVAAVYVDNQRRLNRSTNLIVSGLPPSTIRPDLNAVVDLCRQEFNEALDIVHCMRLGKIITGRTQPLLVVLKTADQAQRIIKAAKNLRQSIDPHTRQHVYIAANLTKAESRAAYEVRCERRQAAERRNQQAHDQQRHQPAASQTVRGSQASAPHQLQQPPRKLQQQEYRQASNCVNSSQSEQIKQLPHHPLPQGNSRNPVTSEAHQLHSHLHPTQQHATQQQHHQQWQHPPSVQNQFVSDPSFTSSFLQHQWQQSQLQSSPLQQGPFVVPQPPSQSSSLNMICVDPSFQQRLQSNQPSQQPLHRQTSSQYGPRGAAMTSLQSLDPSAPAFQSPAFQVDPL